MGYRYKIWKPLSEKIPDRPEALLSLIWENRQFIPLEKLEYGDYGLEQATESLRRVIERNGRVALYADYDVDGTMSCVSWIWFFEAIGFKNYVPYIPCRFKEGYGVNLKAIQKLIDEEKADLILTMDTGITANDEAEYCRSRGVEFICTDHHKIQPERMPDCIILNPKLHPDPSYQELCGCGVTFVLIRRLSRFFPVPTELWTDLLALAGMATICDVVPLNRVNHRLARLGVDALMRSQRVILRRLREAASLFTGMDEKDVGFRLGPRINAVGRLGHAETVVEAFLHEDPDALIRYMNECNEERKNIQRKIVQEATALAEENREAPILFLGGDWHPGVVGIAAGKIAEKFWKPTWLFGRKDGIGKGSARSIHGFDVTAAMQAVSPLFLKFGGHKAAGGFTFDLKNETEIREKLIEGARAIQKTSPELWESSIEYDCSLPVHLLELSLAEGIEGLKPFGYGFDEPYFRVAGEIGDRQYFRDKKTGEPKHTAFFISGKGHAPKKILFFNEVIEDLNVGDSAEFIVGVSKNTFAGNTSISLIGEDFSPV